MSNELMSDVSIRVGGTLLNEATMDKLESVDVDLSLVLPNMFAIRFRDNQARTGKFDLLDSDTFKVGSEVEIWMSAQWESLKSLMKGEITAIEPELHTGGITTLTVRGYDKSHRLYRKQTRTFRQVTDSQIAQSIARENKLQIQADRSSPQYEYVIQDNQTDMEFLQDRARRADYYAYAKDGKLYFVKQPQNGSPEELEWGANLIDFQARLTTAEQVSQVNVHGWDPDTKRAIVGKAGRPVDTVEIEGKHGSSVAQTAFGKTEDYVVDQPVWTPDEANILAQSVLNRRGHAFFVAEGTCLGNPGVQAGTRIVIKGIGTRFSGTYTVSRSVHHHDRSGYRTRFEISGNHANTLGYLLSSKGIGEQRSSGRGIVVGTVTSLEDPENLARVQVLFPTLPKYKDADVASNWARLVTPMAGAERGIQFIPEVHDEVLVAFENDDMSRPYILGALWNKKDKPPDPGVLADDKKGVNRRVIKSRSGHTITLDDTDSKEKISIIDKTGKNSIDIDSKSNAITIKSEADITIEGKGKLTLKGKTILIEATQGGNMDLKANNVNMEAQAKATVKGGTGADIKAAQVNIKGDAATKVEGLTVSINGTTMTEVKGTIVKIN